MSKVDYTTVKMSHTNAKAIYTPISDEEVERVTLETDASDDVEPRIQRATRPLHEPIE